MARKGIRLYGDPALREKGRRVTATDPDTHRLVEDLFDTLHDAKGIGLAAPQIGIPLRVLVLDLSPVELGAKPLAMINPEVISVGEKVRGEEGCLSFPGLFLDVDRPEQAHLRYETPSGKVEDIKATGLLARAMLHELDHLDGVLFIDHLSRARRVLVEAKLRGMLRRQRKGETV
jgi:peptide deformylase